MNHAIIAAGGRGKRMQMSVSKQLFPLRKKPLLFWSLRIFEYEPKIDRIVLVHPQDEPDEPYRRILEQEKFTKITMIPGGDTRFDSVRNGFESLIAQESDVVVIHDAARPLLSAGLLGRVLQTAREKGAVIPAWPVQDTLKEVNGNRILQTISRENYFLAQTPQAFQYGILKKSYEMAGVRNRGALLTDESFLVEKAGIQVFVIPGDRENIKITEAEDLRLAEFYLEQSCSA